MLVLNLKLEQCIQLILHCLFKLWRNIIAQPNCIYLCFLLGSACHFKFEAISIRMPESSYSSSSTVLGDFNNDKRHDIAYVIEKRGLNLNEIYR